MLSRLTRLFIVVSLIAAGVFVFESTHSAQAATSLDVPNAIAWLGTKQQSNGSFEMAGLSGFETPDAVFAIAEAANAGKEGWDPCAARNAVLSHTVSNNSPLHYLDDFVDSSGSTLSVAVAGQIAIYARAMGLDATKFDPDNDGAVNLMQLIDAVKDPAGFYGDKASFATTLWAVLAKLTNDETVDTTTTSYILSTQQANGGFNYAADNTQTGVDIDTTGRVLETLGALGLTAHDTAVKNTLAFLANHQQADGGFLGDFQTESNASSNALVVMGFKALGIDTSNSTWRDEAAPTLVGTAYADPASVLATRQVADGHVTTEFDASFFDTLGTTQAVQGATNTFIPGETMAAIDNDCPIVLGNTITNSGDIGRYRFAFSNGTVWECHPNQACTTASTISHLNKPIVAASVTSSGTGYWLFAADGGVFTYGDAGFFGSASTIHLQKPIVSAQPTPDNGGYTLIAADGGVFTFGNAKFLGSGVDLNLHDVVGGALTHSGNGYWLFGRDGGVFTYGDAGFYGSAATLNIHGHVVAGDTSTGGNGYVLFASDGGVFTYGDATYAGSAANMSLQAPMIKGFTNRISGGYAMLGADGGVFVFGNTDFVVSLAPNHNVVKDLMIG